MVRIISTWGLRVGANEDLYDHSVDGVDYSNVPEEYDYERDLPESARTGKRKLLYNDVETSVESEQLLLGDSLFLEED